MVRRALGLAAALRLGAALGLAEVHEGEKTADEFAPDSQLRTLTAQR